MGRTLPWLKLPAAGLTSPPPTKRQKLLHPTPDSKPDTSNNTRRPIREPLQNANRTPSTSPPPQPPSQQKMRPGLDADDIHIMVEDEFLATAQLYTKHLHHAEYQRLKTLARTRQAHTSGNDMARPVSTTTPMREETRREKAAGARAARIDAGLDPLLSCGRRRRSVVVGGFKDSDEERSESDFEIEQGDDPWRGTQLQRFMTESPRKERKLVGLEGLVSHTRAAAGFAAPEKSGCSNRGSPAISVAADKRNVPEARYSETYDSDDDGDDDDDDLDTPTTRGLAPFSNLSTKPPVRPALNPQTRPNPLLGNYILRRPHPPSSSSSSSKNPPTISTKAQQPNPRQKRAFLDLSPDLLNPALASPPSLSPSSPAKTKEAIKRTHHTSFPSSPPPPPTSECRNPSYLQQRLNAKRARDEKAKATNSNDDDNEDAIKREKRRVRIELDEIPVFLV